MIDSILLEVPKKENIMVAMDIVVVIIVIVTIFIVVPVVMVIMVIIMVFIMVIRTQKNSVTLLSN